MTEKSIEEIREQLQKSPELPVLVLTYHGAAQAYGQLRQEIPGLRLAVMRGMRYLAATDAAVEVLIEQIGRERRQMAKVVETYDRELADLKVLLRRGGGVLWEPGGAAGPPAYAEESLRTG